MGSLGALAATAILWPPLPRATDTNTDDGGGASTGLVIAALAILVCSAGAGLGAQRGLDSER